MDGRPLRPRAGLLGRLERLLRLRALAAGTWSRGNVAVYGDLDVNDPGGAWTLGSAVRVEHFEDFAMTANGKVPARVGFFRAGASMAPIY